MSKAHKPLRLKINHLDYQVLPLDSKCITYEGYNYGLHVPDAIYIDPQQTPSEQARILWHELIHAFWWAYNVPKEPRDEEKICGVLESPLAALFRDNPHLGAALAGAYAGKPIVGIA